MPLLMRLRASLRNLFSPARTDADLDEEIRSHLGMLIEQNNRAGMSPKQAERAARIEMGGIEQLKEQVRAERIGDWLRSVVSDCRYGIRTLFKDRRFALLAIFALALGIGTSTIVFSVVYDGLLNPVPLQRCQRDLDLSDSRRNATRQPRPRRV